jgi:hypothetical protein
MKKGKFIMTLLVVGLWGKRASAGGSCLREGGQKGRLDPAPSQNIF